MSVQVVEGAAIPPPPPIPVQEQQGDDFDPNRGRGLFRIWNAVLVFGPISDAQVRVKVGMTQGAWLEYVRHHPKVKADDYDRLKDVSSNWYLDQEIAIGLKNGYLVRNPDDTLSAGPCPPEHRVPTKGQLRADYIRDDNLIALEILRHKTDPARIHVKDDDPQMVSLKESIRDRGQLYPIKRWRAGHTWIVVDGLSRERVVNDLGLEPWYETYPEDTPAIEVLWDRITLELNGTTKDQTTRTRNAYIARLAKAGLTQEAIAERVALSQKHVSRILSASDIEVYRRQIPPDEVIVEWVRLSDGGWSIRDIAEDYVWGKDTVRKYINQYRSNTTKAADGSVVVKTSPTYKTETKARKYLTAIAELGGSVASSEVAEKHADVSHTGSAWTRLVQDGFVEAGSNGKGWDITLAGREECSLYPKKAPKATSPAPAAPAPAAPAPAAAPSLTVVPDHVHVWVCRDCGVAHPE